MDWYYIRSYVKTFFIILFALMALVAIGDLFQKFDDFVALARSENLELREAVMIFLRYYGSFVPQLVFQYMFPVSMLLAGAITATASFAGPRGNNEYTVIRSAGVPVLRAFFPLLFPAFIIALAFQASRDHFLPAMVREYHAINSRLKKRSGTPITVTIRGEHGLQSASVGWFAPGGEAHNLILEVRDVEKFRRGDPSRGDNDFISYRAALAKLEAPPEGIAYWVPVERAEMHAYTRYSRRSVPWTEPVPTDFTPAMIERQTLGDTVCSWQDLLILQKENASAQFELVWRLAEPVACALLVLWGVGLCMGRMLRGSSASFVQSICISMLAAGVFYALRLAGKSLWEAGVLSPRDGVVYPVAVAALVALPIALFMER